MAPAAAPVQTAFVVAVPEAEALVHELRLRHDPAARLGVPAHLTLLYPFMPAQQITPEVLVRAAAALHVQPAFGFHLARVERFPATVYLVPEPAQPFVSMTEALARAFPAYPPFGGLHPSIVPHLTVGQGGADDMDLLAHELQAALQHHGPVEARCRQVVLLEQAEGRWRDRQHLPLPADGAPAA